MNNGKVMHRFQCAICGAERDIGYEVERVDYPPLENVTPNYPIYSVTACKIVCVDCKKRMQKREC